MSRPAGATIRDVARIAGVSVATVSRTLNGVSSVAPELADRVRQAVAETGYVANSTGRALRRQVLDVWAAIVPDSQNPFFTAVVGALEEVALRNGFSVMLCNTDEDLVRERRYLEAVVSQRIAGVIMAVASEEHSDLTPLLASGVPTVLIDRRVRGFSGDAVLVDNQMAGRIAAEHLVKHGYSRIACIAGPSDVSTTEDRLIGFRDRLAALGVTLEDSQVRRANLRFEGGEIAFRSLWSSGSRPDAVYVTNGPITAGSYRAAQQLDISIPGELALLGTDDDQWTRMVQPALTVIRQPVDRIGRLAGELLAVRAHGSTGPGEAIVLPPSILVREST